MSNMAYCRFENTVGDLRDCSDNMDDSLEHSPSEQRARRALIRLCREIAENYDEHSFAEPGT